jgi:hypothetical protein
MFCEALDQIDKAAATWSPLVSAMRVVFGVRSEFAVPLFIPLIRQGNGPEAGCSQSRDGAGPCFHPIFLECLTVCERGPSAKLGKSLFVEFHLRVDDAIVGIAGEHNHPGIAPLGAA